MATFALTDASVVINSVDLSDHVQSVELNYEADALEDTNMGDSTHIQLGGLKNWTMTIEFSQDFASSSVDATIFPLVGSTTTVTVKPTSGAVSSTNPSFSGTGLVRSYNPLSGSVGDKATCTVEIVAAGDLSRSTV